MRSHLSLFLILFLLPFIIAACGSKLESFDDVRDFIMKESGETFHTTMEVAVSTDNLGIIGNHIKDFDLDTDNYQIKNIETVKVGVYRVENEEIIALSGSTISDNQSKINRRLKRAGYETVIHQLTEDEVSIGLIKESRRTEKGAGYFVHLKPDGFILVKVDADFIKL